MFDLTYATPAIAEAPDAAVEFCGDVSVGTSVTFVSICKDVDVGIKVAAEQLP